MYTLRPGWTKEKMREAIIRGNNGKKSLRSLSEDDIHRCAYRAPDGNKCAAGCFIPDDMYSTKLEGRCVGQLPDYITDQFPLSEYAMQRLQSVHDTYVYGGAHGVKEAILQWIEDNVLPNAEGA